MLLTSTTVPRGRDYSVSPSQGPLELFAQLQLQLRRSCWPRPRPCHSTLPGLLEYCRSPTLHSPSPDWRTGLQPLPLSRDEVAGETGARVPMTTGAVGLAFRVLLASQKLRLMAPRQISYPCCVDF